MHRISNMKKTDKMIKEKNNNIEVGILGKAFGIDGKIRLNIYSGSLRNIKPKQKVLIKKEDDEIWLTISKVAMINGFPVVQFDEIKDRTKAANLTGRKLFISDSDISQLDENEIYVRDLIGMTVYDRRSEKEIGKIVDIMTNSRQPIYVIKRTGDKEVLIPGVSEFIKEIDINNKTVEVELIPGFI